MERLEQLRETDKARVALGTGCWEESSRIKLEAAGLDLAYLPKVTSCHYFARGDIITRAVELAG